MCRTIRRALSVKLNRVHSCETNMPPRREIQHPTGTVWKITRVISVANKAKTLSEKHCTEENPTTLYI